MTDARFPERWLNDRRILRLSDAAFRMFVMSLAWSVANKTDGWLTLDDLMLIPGCTNEGAQELYDAELWWPHMEHAQITEFDDTQSSRDELDALAARRRADRQRSAAARARKARSAAEGRASSRDASRDRHADRVRTGQDRPGSPKNVVQGLEPPPQTSGTEPYPSPQTSDGSKTVVPDDQHFLGDGVAGRQGDDRYAREVLDFAARTGVRTPRVIAAKVGCSAAEVTRILENGSAS